MEESPKRLETISMSSVGLTDRISDLPHCILQHILSFLPTKDAIKFCTLSKQWDSLWKSIPILSFYSEYSFWDFEKIERFVSFVDKTLTTHTSSKICKFSLFIDSRYHTIEKKVESWISFATSRQVQELCLSFGLAEYRENGVLYSNCSAMKMSLTSFRLCYERGFRVHWTALKALSLINTVIDGTTLGSVLHGSPLIEFLGIRDCRFRVTKDKCVIDISCASLKELVIESCETNVIDADYLGQIEIRGPNLLSLSLVGKMKIKSLKFVYVPSLVEATIDFFISEAFFFCRASHNSSVLHELRHVNKFTVGTRSIKVISMRSDEGAFFGKSRRKILKVTMNSNKACFLGIAALLNSSPDLEQLTIKIIPAIDYGFKLNCFPEDAEGNNWRSEIGSEKLLFRNLKIVEIVGFMRKSASNNLGKLMVELAQLLLTKAKVLQKLIIHVEAIDGHDKLWSSQSKLLEISQKFSCCPRASPNAVVILKN